MNTNSPETTRIVCASHRGGSWKTTVACGLARCTVRQEMATLLLDLSVAGGCYEMDSPDLEADAGTTSGGANGVAVRRHRGLPLRVARAAFRSGQADDLAGTVDEAWPDPGPRAVIIDAPQLGPDDLGRVTADADVLLLTVPARLDALNSLVPFLEKIYNDRSQRGRHYRVAAVLTGVVHNPVDGRVTSVAESVLSPLRTGVYLERNEELDQLISNCRFDYGSEKSPLESQFQLLLQELMSPRLQGVAP